MTFFVRADVHFWEENPFPDLASEIWWDRNKKLTWSGLVGVSLKLSDEAFDREILSIIESTNFGNLGARNVSNIYVGHYYTINRLDG